MRQHKRMGRKDVRRRRGDALNRLERYIWVNSKRCRLGDTDQGIWAQRGEDEIAILKTKLETTQETSYDF